MNTLKEKLWTVLVTSVILQRFGEVDAYSVDLFPSPIAKVEEGKTLTLHCICNESIHPDLINWYLNNDTMGLLIKTSSCTYLVRPPQYEIKRYKPNCHEIAFELSIVNISKGDHQDIWECDYTVSGMHPQRKASTRIELIEDADQPDTKSRQHDNADPAVVVLGVFAVIVVIALIIAVATLRKRINDCVKNMNKKNYDQPQEQREMLGITGTEYIKA